MWHLRSWTGNRRHSMHIPHVHVHIPHPEHDVLVGRLEASYLQMARMHREMSHL